MRAYTAIFKGRLAVLLQYRLAAFAGLSTQVFWGLIKIMILQAFFAHSTAPQPISLAQAIEFIWIGQALLQLLPWNLDKDIEAQVKTGHVAYELVRPLNLYWLWFFRSMALRLIPTVMRSIPLVCIAGLFFGLILPVSWAAAGLFTVSLIFATLLSSAMTTLVVISLFWTVSGEGVQRLLPHLTMLLSGMVLPLPLFPDWMQPLLSIQPFRGIIDIPVRLYTGIIPSHEAVYYLAFQCVWLLIFVVAGRWLMNVALKRISIQGG
jgi:ABC-2 type transport system permease protein